MPNNRGTRRQPSALVLLGRKPRNEEGGHLPMGKGEQKERRHGTRPKSAEIKDVLKCQSN